MKILLILFLTFSLCAPVVSSQEGWYCVNNCPELFGDDLPGNAGPGQIILNHPNYPNCPLMATYRAWACLENVMGKWKLAYRLRITGWHPINVNDQGCAGLKSDMFPSGYPGPVDQDFVLGVFNDLIPRVSEYFFLNDPDNLPASYPCPDAWTTQEFIQGSCVKLVQGSHT